MLSQKDQYIASAYEQLQVISQDKEKRLEYEARQKAIRDYNQMMLEAERRGEKRGIEQGLEEGLKQGLERGEKKAGERINKLHALLVQDERYDDLKRCTSDEDFQKELMEQYNI